MAENRCVIPMRRLTGLSSPEKTAGGRIRVALVALFFVLAHLGGLSHFAGSRHAVCEEHGRLEHGATAAGGAIAADPADPSPRFDAPPDGAPHSQHDGCHLSFLTRAAQFTKPAGVATPIAAVSETRAPSHLAPRAPASVPVILLAPKHSPPASA